MLKGNSNYNITVKHCDEGFTVLKKAITPEEFEKLCKHVHKQKNFHYILKNKKELNCFFEVPEVLDIHLKNGSVEMKFCNGKSILDIIEQEDIFVLDSVLDEIFVLLQWEFNTSPPNNLNKKIWEDKIKDLKNKINDESIIKVLDVLNIGFDEKIHIGNCHGDLTFSNMLFSNKIVLLDFLDSFVETPIIDLTKLMQEVYLKWSLILNSEDRDTTKIIIGYNYLLKKFNEKLEVFLQTNNISKLVLNSFYKLTLIRILPYCKSEYLYNTIHKEIMCQP